MKMGDLIFLPRWYAKKKIEIKTHVAHVKSRLNFIKMRCTKSKMFALSKSSSDI